MKSLNLVTKGLTGEAYTQAFKNALADIKKEISTPGSNLNNKVTKKDSEGNSTVKSKQSSETAKPKKSKK